MSKWTPSTWHANAQEFFPRNPPREQLASIGGYTNAARWYPKPMFLDDAYAVPGLRKGQRDGESSEPCQSVSCIRQGCALNSKLCEVSYLPPPATRTSTSVSVFMQLDLAKEGTSGGYSEPGTRPL